MKASATVSYDGFGRTLRVTAPSGERFRYYYDNRSFVTKVADDLNGPALWRPGEYDAGGSLLPGAYDAAGNLLAESLGNGVVTTRSYDTARGWLKTLRTRSKLAAAGTFDLQDLSYVFNAVGNITSRRNAPSGQTARTESFTYDTLDRLTGSAISGVSSQAVSYDALGNILSKSGVGSYSYGAGPAGPHAVTGMTGSNTLSFGYDANGNMTGVSGSIARTIGWTSFDQPSQITRGSNTVSFAYGAEHQRIRQVSPVDTSYYFAPAGSFRSERRVAPGGGVSWTTYVSVGDRLVATLDKTVTVPAGAPSYKYLLSDHLGSVETVTDAGGGLGGLGQNLSFDAWGVKRLANWAAGTPLATERRGFTGHEQLDSVGLVHMNGRLYDPLLGRFLSADPAVQFPGNLQNYNRYSYALNNPLSYTDPSGYFLKKLFKGIGKVFKGALKFIASRQFLAMVTMVVITTVLTPAVGPVAAAAIGGFASGYIATGTLKGAVLSAATAAIGAGMGTLVGPYLRVVADGVVGGTVAEISGGDFKQGFLSAGFSALVSGPAPAQGDFGTAAAYTAYTAVIGGTASVIGGGKFANGAYSAAFSYAVSTAATSSLNSSQTGQTGIRAVPIIGDIIQGLDWIADQVQYGLDVLFEAPSPAYENASIRQVRDENSVSKDTQRDMGPRYFTCDLNGCIDQSGAQMPTQMAGCVGNFIRACGIFLGIITGGQAIGNRPPPFIPVPPPQITIIRKPDES